MHRFLVRRAASRAIAAKPYNTLLAQQRSIITAARPALVSRQQWFATSFQKRFASDEVKPTDAEEVVKAEASDLAPEETSAVTGQDAQLEGENSQGNTLYVGNLFFEVTEDSLQRLFSEHGDIQKVKIIYDHRGLSKGFGYVTFASALEASNAIDALNQQPFQGRRLSVQPHQPRERINPGRSDSFDRVNNPSRTLFIGNMSFDMSDKDLNDLFREVQNVVDVRVAIDRRTGQPRGFAHCDLLDIESATKAKEILDQKEVHGRQLRVDFSQSTSDRPARDSPPRRNYDNNGPPRDRRNGPPRERRSYDNARERRHDNYE
ncbi:gb [Venturia nashicola]|uniref:Gb n=1 Tax=Venturia nashicola TaxID=86259 RepID=A0A4Z1P028_9PEZI|nr:gb [Venturia nashicola]